MKKSVSEAAKFLGIKAEWILAGLQKEATTLVVMHDNFDNSFWPMYYQPGEVVPVVGTGKNHKYAFKVADLTEIELNQVLA